MTSEENALLYTAAQRQETLDRLLAALATDERIAGVIVVGSGSVGFEDAYSDVDLDVVMYAADDVAPVCDAWTERIRAMFEVWGQFSTNYAPDSFLRGFLLANYLEVDIGFVHLGNLQAGKWRWQVAFDRSGQIEAIQQQTWAERQKVDAHAVYVHAIGGIWHYVLHVAVATRRGQVWRALHDLDSVRLLAVELAGLRYELNVTRGRQADQLPADFLAALEETLPGSSAPADILRALRAATACFFEQARAVAAMIGSEPPDALAEHLQTLLETWR